MFYLERKTLEADPSIDAGKLEIDDWPERYATLARQVKNPVVKAFYEAGVVDPKTPISDVPLVALDFETTGLDYINDGIVSIGLVPLTIQRIQSSQSQYWLVKPRAALTEESVVLHGITHSDIERAPDLLKVLSPLLEHMRGKIAVVHHKGIERNFLNTALRIRIGTGIDFPVIDTMELEARLHRRKPLGFWKTLFGFKPISIRLTESRTRYNLPFYRPHNAASDALACAELLQAQIATHYSPETPISELWG